MRVLSATGLVEHGISPPLWRRPVVPDGATVTLSMDDKVSGCLEYRYTIDVQHSPPHAQNADGSVWVREAVTTHLFLGRLLHHNAVPKMAGL